MRQLLEEVVGQGLFGTGATGTWYVGRLEIYSDSHVYAMVDMDYVNLFKGICMAL
jgi:hypothetical protein